MHVIARAYAALALVASAAATSEPPAASFEGVADPAARAAFQAMAQHVGRLTATVESQASELDEQRARTAVVEARLAAAEAALAHGFRRAQEALVPTTTVVHLHHATVTLRGPGYSGMTGPSSGNGHRRTQAAACGDLNVRAAAVTAECCDEASEDCSSGAPASCNAGCAALFLPFWNDCGAPLGQDSPQYLAVVAQCQAAAEGSGGSGDLAHEFNLVCADGAVDSCVPACSQQLRGDLLLLNLADEDH